MTSPSRGRPARGEVHPVAAVQRWGTAGCGATGLLRGQAGALCRLMGRWQGRSLARRRGGDLVQPP